MSLVYIKRDCFRHFKGYQEEFEQSLGQVQNLVLQCWGSNCAGLQCRLGVFDKLSNLCLINNTFAKAVEENMIIPFPYQADGGEEEGGKNLEVKCQNPSFLKYSRKPNAFYMIP